MFFKPLIKNETDFYDFGALTVLIGDSILLDAGTVISELKAEQQSKIKHIFITHSHLDHIKDLGFLADNVFATFKEPITVYGTKTTIDIIKNHIFNSLVWADFTKIPDESNPIMRFCEINPNQTVEVEEYSVTSIEVNHVKGALGYLVSGKGGNVLVTGDTGPTEEIWNKLNGLKGPSTVYIETSFPNRLRDVAKQTAHLTPESLKGELSKIKKEDVKIFVCHIKKPYFDEITKEIKDLNDKRVSIL